MRTTIDLPDDLFRRAKAVAALRGQSLKDLIASYVESGLGLSGAGEATGHNRPLPEFISRSGISIPSLSNAEIEEMLMKEDLTQLGFDRSA